MHPFASDIVVKAEHAVLLLLCDSRKPLLPLDCESPETLDANSVFALPRKREMLRTYSMKHDIDIEGEVIIELELGVDMQFLIDSTIAKIMKFDCDSVLSVDGAGLAEAGLFHVLSNNLLANNIHIIEA